MKKQNVLLVTILLFSLYAKAQDNISKSFEVMSNIGFSASTLNFEDVPGSKLRFSVQAGILGDYYLSERWSIRSGVSYFAMGQKNPEVNIELDYLNIPLNANWHFGKTKKWNLNFGGTFGYLLNGKLNNVEAKDQLKSYQIALSYGVGYKFRVTDNFSILTDFQGLFGLTDIYKNNSKLEDTNLGSSLNIGGVLSF